jgi:flagellar protein FlbD
MIQLTRINLVQFYLNPDLIEHMETTPDTVISLTTGQKFVVVEPAEQVIERIVAFRRRIGNSPRPARAPGGQEE